MTAVAAKNAVTAPMTRKPWLRFRAAVGGRMLRPVFVFILLFPVER